jgi:glycosyltransferase involved in cell wall biosynthesis
VTEVLPELRSIQARDASRPDLLIHALAQLPDRVELGLHAPSDGHADLRALARAYGIEQRLQFSSSGSKSSIPPYATMAELVEALGRPDDQPAATARRGRSLSGERVALITNLPAPYRLPLFRALDRRLADEDATLHVFFLGARSERSWMNAEPGGFEYEMLSSVRLPTRHRPPLIPANLERRLAAFRPTIVVAGGLSPLVATRAGYFAKRHRLPFGVWSGEIATMGTAQGRVRTIQRRQLLRLADFALTYGFYAGEYLRALRPDLPVVYARNTSVIDVEPRRPHQHGALELLMVGDLSSPRKGIDIGIEALRRVPELDCRLTVVGGGALLQDAKDAARGDERIRFVGAQPPAEVKRHYEDADVLLFPTRADVYGLVVPEAMAAGLTVITAANPGVVGDLPVSGHNALVVDGHDPAGWATAIGTIADDAGLRSALGEAAARSIAGRWTTLHAAEAMLAGLRLGLETRKAP